MFTKDISSTFDKNVQSEWLVTNGIGGYASSTIINANTRKYHGLLVASIGGNLDRYMVLSKLNEYVIVDGQKYSISSNECKDYIEKGYVYEEAFERKMLPEFLYGVKGVEISKKVAMLHGQNKVCIKYNIVNTTDSVAYFTAVPFVNYRGFHEVKNAGDYIQHYDDNILCIDVSKDNKLYIKFDESEYIKYDSTFYNNMYYRVEAERGFDAFESHYMPGEFRIELDAKSKKELFFVAEFNSNCTIDDKETKSIVRGEEIRLEKVCKMASCLENNTNKELVVASDSFIIDKKNGKSIVAGYPWFSDWGRDTFISLEGLLLKTNRFTDAKAVLKYFANYIRRGLVPNYIDESGGGSYNTVDASLWYIEAVYKYFNYTSDYSTLKELFPKLLEIVYSYMVGTDFGIYMCDDGLITAGSPDTQLTWMDAKVGDCIPTPRYGKAVEINSLWYNALRSVEELNKRLINKYCADMDDSKTAHDIINSIYYLRDESNSRKNSEKNTKNLFLSDEVFKYYEGLTIVFDGRLQKKVKESFKKFYADEGLFDTIDPYNEQIRPNQIISLSLSFPILSGDKAKEVLALVSEKLLTKKGLKSLNSEDKDYRPRYEGDSYNRDISYHQGTIWVWLIGEYARAFEFVNKKKFVAIDAMELLNDGIVGNVAEIYDADEPHYAKGALAQAWSVSALIKVLM